MTNYLTRYILNNQVYSSQLTAQSVEEALSIARMRNIGEIVDLDSGAYKSEPVIDIIDLLHQCCFLSFIALKSTSFDLESVLSDQGVLHRLIHYIDRELTKTVDQDKLINDIKELYAITHTIYPNNVSSVIKDYQSQLSKSNSD